MTFRSESISSKSRPGHHNFVLFIFKLWTQFIDNRAIMCRSSCVMVYGPSGCSIPHCSSQSAPAPGLDRLKGSIVARSEACGLHFWLWIGETSHYSPECFWMCLFWRSAPVTNRSCDVGHKELIIFTIIINCTNNSYSEIVPARFTFKSG